MVSDGTKLYVGCKNGNVYAYDGSTWADIGQTGDSLVYSLCLDGNGLYAGNGDYHVYRNDFNSGWTDIGVTRGGCPARGLAWDGKNVYAVNEGGQVYRYDGGTTWTDVWPDGKESLRTIVWTGTDLYVGTSARHSQVYRYDGGTTWTDTGLVAIGFIHALAWNGSNLFAETSDPYWGAASVYRYEVTGAWTDIWPESVGAYALTWNGANLIAATDSGYIHRYEGGTTWKDIGYVRDVEALVWDGTNLFSGGIGVYVYQGP